MKKLLLSLFFALAFLFIFGSVFATDLNIVSINNITASPGTAASFFVISNNHSTSNITNITCSVSIAGWSTSCSCPSWLANNSSQTASFSVTIPQYTTPGTYFGLINVSGTLDNTTTSDSDSFAVNVSAASNIEISWLKEPSNLYQGESQVIEFNVTNIGNILLNMEINITSTPELVSSFSSFLLMPNVSKEVNLTIETSSSTRAGTYTLKISAVGKNETVNITKESEKNFDIFYQYCIVREKGNISLQNIVNEDDIKDEEFGPLDSFEIDVRVRNDDKEKHYAVVEAVLLYDNNEIGETEVREEVKISDYDSEEISLTMKIPPDVEEGYYYLYIKVYDEDNRDNCEQRQIRFRVNKESYLAIPYSIAIEPTKVNCSQLFKITGRVANIGSHDEDKIRIVYEDDFGNSNSKVFNDINEGSLSSLFSFQSEVPADADEGSHTITLHIYYDYDDVSGYYEKDDEYEYYLTVEGKCYKPKPVEKKTEFSLTTQLVEIVGKKVNVFISVKNTGNANAVYIIDVVCDWAVVNSISQPQLTIEPGQSKSITIELTPKEGTVEGIHYLEVGVSVDETREAKSIPINVQKQPQTWRQKLETLASEAKEEWIWLTIDAVLVLIIFALIAHFVTRPRMPRLLQR